MTFSSSLHLFLYFILLITFFNQCLAAVDMSPERSSDRKIIDCSPTEKISLNPLNSHITEDMVYKGVTFHKIEVPDSIVKGVPFSITAHFTTSVINDTVCGPSHFFIEVNGKQTEHLIHNLCDDNKQFLSELTFKELIVHTYWTTNIKVTSDYGNREASTWSLPGLITLIPPIVLVIVSIKTKMTFPSILLSLWLGCTFIRKFNPITGLLDLVGDLFVDVASERGTASIFIFTFLLAAVTAFLARSSGSSALVDLAKRFASSPRKSMITAIVLAFVLFFDDYACLIVTISVMRPIFSNMNITAVKLAHIADVSASTLCSCMVITSWIGFMSSILESQLSIVYIKSDPISFIIKSIPFAFYPLVNYFLMLVTVFSGKEMGKMYYFESKANTMVTETAQNDRQVDKRVVQKLRRKFQGMGLSRLMRPEKESDSESDNDIDAEALVSVAKTIYQEIGGEDPHIQEPDYDSADELDKHKITKVSPLNALLPIFVIFIVLVSSIVFIGIRRVIVIKDECYDDLNYYKNLGRLRDYNSTKTRCESYSLTPMDILEHTDPYVAILWASSVGVLVAAAVCFFKKILSAEETLQTFYGGCKSVIEAICSLLGAFSLGVMVSQLQATTWLAQVIGGTIPTFLLPMVTFFLAAMCNLASGSTFSTMSLLYPFVFQIAHHLHLRGEVEIIFSSVGSVVAGSLFGSNLSFGSDCSVLSSMLSGCTVFDHVTTMLSYTIISGVTSSILCVLAGLGVSPIICLALGFTSVLIIVLVFGKSVHRTAKRVRRASEVEDEQNLRIIPRNQTPVLNEETPLLS
ncbi:hypothetical protein PCE1_004355 [Barthelona sp. PCE]